MVTNFAKSDRFSHYNPSKGVPFPVIIAGVFECRDCFLVFHYCGSQTSNDRGDVAQTSWSGTRFSGVLSSIFFTFSSFFYHWWQSLEGESSEICPKETRKRTTIWPVRLFALRAEIALCLQLNAMIEPGVHSRLEMGLESLANIPLLVYGMAMICLEWCSMREIGNLNMSQVNYLFRLKSIKMIMPHCTSYFSECVYIRREMYILFVSITPHPDKNVRILLNSPS